MPVTSDKVIVRLKRDDDEITTLGVRVAFSVQQCFRFDDGREDRRCIDLLVDHLRTCSGLAVYGATPLLSYLLKHRPDLAGDIRALVIDGPASAEAQSLGVQIGSPSTLPPGVETVFLCETRTFPRQQMRKRLPAGITIVEPTILGDIAGDQVPLRAWSPVTKHIYPIDVPEIEFEPGLDLVLMDCPARNLALMPNGLAYVHNALKRSTVRFQTFDLDIVTYHRYHIARLFDEGGTIVLPTGRKMPADPWQAEHYDLWSEPDVIAHCRPIIEEAAAALVRARPKVLGLSIHACNETMSRELIRLVREQLPEIIVVVGGFSCYNADVGRRAFPECDYMCIGEADLTVGPLMEALARGERPANQPGILSRFDTPGSRFIPAPMPHKLEKIEFPKYEWFGDLSIYRNFNGYQLTPILASRGCRWSRCTFCAERFYWRIRPAEEFVDELEWLVDHGCYLYMLNESDLNGSPERLLEICDEIIRRNVRVNLTGQLRIHKKNDRAFFDKLRAAGFVGLRFGVDAFSENTLRLQKKGYTTAMVSQNLRDCTEAGLYTEVNWVIGVPGETDADVDEGIELILANRQHIGRLANINPLMLVNGGVYWLEPEAHNIVFHAPKEELYVKHPRAVPAEMWHSTEPYIDATVRRQRFEYIVRRLHEAGFPIGAWAARTIEDIHKAGERIPDRASRDSVAPAAAAGGD
jgi:radical SAM superfamily enzyme YgiQ (UPF0313 family)